MLVSELVRLICEEVRSNEEDSFFDEHYVYQKMDMIGDGISSLDNPLNIDPTVAYFRPREKPLSGNEEVKGEFLLFEYVSHHEAVYLKEMDSINSIEEAILSEGGITNAFTTYMIAIINGKVRHYEISFFDQTRNSRRCFDKIEQYNSSNPFRTYESLQIKWIDDDNLASSSNLQSKSRV